MIRCLPCVRPRRARMPYVLSDRNPTRRCQASSGFLPLGLCVWFDGFVLSTVPALSAGPAALYLHLASPQKRRLNPLRTPCVGRLQISRSFRLAMWSRKSTTWLFGREARHPTAPLNVMRSSPSHRARIKLHTWSDLSVRWNCVES